MIPSTLFFFEEHHELSPDHSRNPVSGITLPDLLFLVLTRECQRHSPMCFILLFKSLIVSCIFIFSIAIFALHFKLIRK